MVEFAPDIVVRVDDHVRVAYVNDRVTYFLAHRPEDLIGMPAFALLHPDDLMAASLGFQDALAGGGEIGSIPVRLRHNDGSWVPFELEARRIEGDTPGVVVIARICAGERGASELQRISALLRAQQESSPDGILIVSGSARTLSYNRRFLELWGLDPDTAESGYEARATAVTALLKKPDDMVALVDRIYADALGTFHTNVELVDGRTLEAHTVPLLAADGQFNARIWYYRDITDRLAADREIVASEERHRRLVDLSPNGIAVHQGGILRYVNTTGARLFGRSPGDLLGINVFQHIHPEDRPRVIGSAMSSDFETPEFVEVRLITPDGEELFVEIASASTTFNGQPATQSVYRDVTDRRRAEAAMRESEERYRSLVESFPDPVFVHDGLDVIYANPAAAEFLGFGHPDEVAGKGAFDVLGGIPHQEWLSRVNRVISGESIRVRERAFLVYAGREAELEVAYSPATFGGQQCVQVLIRDLTDIRKAESERLALERKLLEAQKLESLGVLAGGVAHDFNNLLVAIMGNAGLAAMELTANPGVAATYLNEVETAAMRAADLARQMLAYSGRGNFVVAPLDLSEMVTEMTSLLSASMPRKVSLEYRLPERPAPVESSPIARKLAAD
ncbi:MAG TPA: PAS domain S-box protein, partial [Tepidiformaceae bacterium]|nr:PAS domain S-box protein [Tepidiformaceae bacterium]